MLVLPTDYTVPVTTLCPNRRPIPCQDFFPVSL